MASFKCDNGHLLVIGGDEKRVIQKVNKGLFVCSHCKPDNVRLTHIPDNKFSGEQFSCSKNHLTIIYPFANGMCNVEWAGNQENIEADPDVMQDMLDSGAYKCSHIFVGKNGKSRKCNCKLKSVSGNRLSTPSVNPIKTSVRIGDIWDKAGCPEPRDSSVEIERRGGKDYDARLNETEFSRRNKSRVKQMRRKKNERLSNPSGEVLDKPTKKSYK